jgi:translocation and assembly module TamB
MRRAALYTGIAAAVLVVAAVAAALLTLRSAWFRDQVRERIVAEAERATGGRVEIARFDFDWTRLRAVVSGFVLHGTEPGGAPPLVRADSIEVGLRVVSVLKRDIDLASVVVRRPAVGIRIAADGSTNIPRPRVPSGRDPVAEILKLAIQEFELRDGVLDLDSRRLPLDLRGRRLRTRVVYEAATPRYQGEISARDLTVAAAGAPGAAVDLELRAALERNRAEFSQIRLTLGRSSLAGAASVENFKAPRMTGRIDATVWLADAARFLRLPVERQGQVQVSGAGVYAGPEAYSFEGRVMGQGLAVSTHGVRVAGAGVAGALRLDPGGLAVENLLVHALGGVFRGRAQLAAYRRLSVEGGLSDFAVYALGRVHQETAHIPWSGRVGGTVKLTGDVRRDRFENTHVAAELDITSLDGPRPVEGVVSLAYDQKSGSLSFVDSRLATPASRVQFSGALDGRLRVDFETADLEDLLAGAAAFRENAPASLPVALENGSASFRGSIEGALAGPRITGRVGLKNFRYDHRLFQRLDAEVVLTPDALRARSFQIERDGTHLEGRGEVALEDWKPADTRPFQASLTLRGGDLKALAREAGLDPSVAGVLAAEARVWGTPAKPEIAARLEISRLRVAEFEFDRARAQLHYRPGLLEIREARLEAGPARLALAASYTHPEGDFASGRLRFEVVGERVPMASLPPLAGLGKDLAGEVELKASGALEVRQGAGRLVELNGTAAAPALAYRQRPAGALAIEAATSDGRLELKLAGKLAGAGLRGAGQWRLEGDYPGSARVEFEPVNLTALRALFAPDREAPFEGVIAGQASVEGSLGKPESLLGEVRLPTFELRPQARERAIPEAARGLFLRNAEPVVLALNSKSVEIRQARFTGRNTSLEVSGGFTFGSRNPWNLQVRGGLDLPLFSSLYPEIVTSGRASLNATVRGSLDEPLFGGRMELQDASIFLADVPSGIENANGVLSFDRNRATIERLTAQAGGGRLRLSGFVGIGRPELVYRLQAEAEKVRVRYPQGVSTTVSGSLSFTGTSTRSLVAGSATIERAAFNPRTDLGSLLAESARPISTPVPTNPVLTGMQFDIRVLSSPTLELQTSLAKNLQAEADLRLRGSAAKPVVLGRVAINQGEIQFFGNKYTITRGDIAFYNPARIEPVVDMDLETRVRGVVVNLAFSGPMSKLNMSYRSDPPLQSQEIIALLAVGRAPGADPTQAAAQSVSAQGGLPAATDSLIGQAISTPISGRLQRFFGVSRLKIDPHLTGTEITPQARLTVEQQISRDITLTYVTNLSEAKEQLVRLEWDMNRQWSVVAVRDENGVFGIDFLYKKRFR